MRHNGFDHDHQGASPSSRKKRPRSYVKKPLNAFMLFMKQERQKVIEEGTLKESAAINQILGRRVCMKSPSKIVYLCICVHD